MATEVSVEDLRSRTRSEARSAGRVEEYMTRDPICFRRDTPLEEALRALIEHKISGAPVVEPYDGDETGSGRLVGVLSEEDLLWKEVDATDRELASAFRAPYLWSMMTSDTSMLETYEDQALKVLSQSVGLSMSEQSISVTPDTPVRVAATIMLDAKVKRLPVVAPRAGGRPGVTVVGVISRNDVLRHVLRVVTERRGREGEVGQGEGEVAGEGGRVEGGSGRGEGGRGREGHEEERRGVGGGEEEGGGGKAGKGGASGVGGVAGEPSGATASGGADAAGWTGIPGVTGGTGEAGTAAATGGGREEAGARRKEGGERGEGAQEGREKVGLVKGGA